MTEEFKIRTMSLKPNKPIVEMYKLLEVIMEEAENDSNLVKFIRESNMIEGITREPTPSEIRELDRFVKLRCIRLSDLERFVDNCTPGHKLRHTIGMNVTIGDHIPPLGGVSIGYKLLDILDDMEITKESAFNTHNDYESLHPFTDGNGRSGRAIWLWQMTKVYGHTPRLSFLQSYYYQSLDFCRK